MKRREFITLLCGATTTWPLAARAKQPERVRRIGVLMPVNEDDPVSRERMAAFLQGLQQLGWSDGRNVRIDYRWGANDADRIRRYAAELVALAMPPRIAFHQSWSQRRGSLYSSSIRPMRLLPRQT